LAKISVLLPVPFMEAMKPTNASPYNQLPLALGADLAVESLAKYINGHGDSLGGAISPFNAWLIMREAVTLPY
jgi:methionine-gamma-lyase